MSERCEEETILDEFIRPTEPKHRLPYIPRVEGGDTSFIGGSPKINKVVEYRLTEIEEKFLKGDLTLQEYREAKAQCQ